MVQVEPEFRLSGRFAITPVASSFPRVLVHASLLTKTRSKFPHAYATKFQPRLFRTVRYIRRTYRSDGSRYLWVIRQRTPIPRFVGHFGCLIDSTNQILEIDNVALMPAVRGEGIMSRCIRGMVAQLAGPGWTITVRCMLGNSEGMRLYKKLGLKETSSGSVSAQSVRPIDAQVAHLRANYDSWAHS